MTIEDTELENLINDIEFEKCEKLQVGDILHFDLNTQITLKKMIKSIYCIIRNNYMGNYNYEIVGNPNMLMLFSNAYADRQDHWKAFNKVCLTTTDYIKIFPKRYRLDSNLHTFKLTYKWIKTFKILGMNTKRALYLARILHQAYCDYERVRRILLRTSIEVKSAVTWCDIMYVDSYFVQRWNQRGIITVSLQHGTYNVGHYGYTHLKSDYLLAQNKFSANNAVKSGVDVKKIVVVGAPQNIQVNYNKKREDNTGIIGLVFGGTRLAQNDIELLMLARQLTARYNYKVYIKLHPGYGIEKYKMDITKYAEKIYESDTDAYQFADLVDILIDDGSTLFVEYSVRGRNAITFLGDGSPYKDDPNIKLGFRTYEELEDIYKIYETDSKQFDELLRQNREYLGTINDPYVNYKEFFDKIKNKK